jgi:ribosomal protein L36
MFLGRLFLKNYAAGAQVPTYPLLDIIDTSLSRASPLLRGQSSVDFRFMKVICKTMLPEMERLVDEGVLASQVPTFHLDYKLIHRHGVLEILAHFDLYTRV